MKEEQSDLLGGTDFKHSMEVRKKNGQYHSYRNEGEETEKI